VIWFGLVLLLAAPFWESRAPADWTEQELETLLTDSPWAQTIVAPGKDDAPPVVLYLATAGPMELAEVERDRRFKRKRPNEPVDTMAEEYRAWLKENRGSQIVLAVAIGRIQGMAMEQEAQRMEQECVMHVGRKKFKMTGHFPPSPGDRYLRLAFPREVTASDKSVTFELYLPGVAMPYRNAEFKVKDMILKGKLEI
jgi:hypothetical protein